MNNNLHSDMYMNNPQDSSVIQTHHPHTHDDNFELLYVIEGSLRALCDEKFYTLIPDDIFLVFPGQIHSYMPLTSENTQVLFCSPPLSQLKFINNFLDKKLPESPLYHCNDETIKPLFQCLLKEFEESEKSHVSVLLLNALLEKIFTNYSFTKKANSTNSISEILLYCQLNFKENLSLKRLSEDLYLSQNYISYLFNKRLHISCNDYINSLRIENTLNLVKSSGYSLTRAAFESGFTSQRTFNRAFKKFYNLTPREFISKNKLEIKE